MGFLTDNVNSTGKQILEWQSQIIDYKNKINYLVETLKVQLYAMETNPEFSEEDCDELRELINSL